MAGSSNPGYQPGMSALPIPDDDSQEVQPTPMIDWAAPVPAEPTDLVDALIGDSVVPGQPFVRVVSLGGQADVSDGTA